MVKVHGFPLLVASLFTLPACGEVVEQNVPPSAPVISLEPSDAYILDELRCTLVQEATDPDGDEVTHSVTWTVNGSEYPSPATTRIPGDTIPAGITQEGEAWECTVTATDPEGAFAQATSVRSIRCATGGSVELLPNGTASSGTLQTFTVPAGVCRITIDAYGAQGGAGPDTRGARMMGTFAVLPGSPFKILVGQRCGDMVNDLCGGGGTFVATPASEPLLVAGGGGSCFGENCPDISEIVGRSETSGGTAGDTPRADGGAGGGSANAASGGGGGFHGDGANPHGGKSFLSGGSGGMGNTQGGYGGGGARQGLWGQGGGGGYSGGSCGDLADQWRGCGGGGSFNAGMDQVNEAGVNEGHGKVVITW